MSNQVTYIIYIYNKRTFVDRLRAVRGYCSQHWFSLYALLRSQYTMVFFFTGCCFFFMCCYADECIAMNKDGETGQSQQPLSRDASGGPSPSGPSDGQGPYENMNSSAPLPVEGGPCCSRRCCSSLDQCCPTSSGDRICTRTCPTFCTENRLDWGVTCAALCGVGGSIIGLCLNSLPIIGGLLGVGCVAGGVGGALCGNVIAQVTHPCMSKNEWCLDSRGTHSEDTEVSGPGGDPSGSSYQHTPNISPAIRTQPLSGRGGRTSLFDRSPGANFGYVNFGYTDDNKYKNKNKGRRRCCSKKPCLPEIPEDQEYVHKPEKKPDFRGRRHSLPIVSLGGPVRKGKKADLLSGYYPGAHVSSLLGMQHVLVTTSERVLNTLKSLALRAYETTTETTHAAQQGSVGGSVLRKRPGTSCASMSALQRMQSFRPYTFFGGADQYRSNLENKVRSGVAGLILNPTSRLSVGVSYNRHYDEGQERYVRCVGLSTGSAKAKTILDGLSMVVAWNTEAAGFTGHVASCCGWGNAKTTRTVVHGRQDVTSKGRPDVSLRGGAAQFGYNIQNKYVSCTPYIECLVSRVAWDPYTEVSGKLPCTISRNKEQIVEQNIGLRKSWKMNETATVQVWVAEVFGRRKTNTLTSRPSLAPLSRYEVSVPMHKRRYSRTEFGTSYRAQVTEVLMLNVDGRFRRSRKGTLDDHNMSVNLHYSY